MSCKGLHCRGCGNQGGSSGGAGVLVLVLIGAAALGAHAAWPSITALAAEVVAVLVLVVKVLTWTVIALAGLAAAWGATRLTLVTVRAWRGYRHRTGHSPLHSVATTAHAVADRTRTLAASARDRRTGPHIGRAPVAALPPAPEHHAKVLPFPAARSNASTHQRSNASVPSAAPKGERHQ